MRHYCLACDKEVTKKHLLYFWHYVMGYHPDAPTWASPAQVRSILAFTKGEGYPISWKRFGPRVLWKWP